MIARTNRILRIMRFLYIFLFLSITLNLQAQVTGVVKDTAGEPIPGANVFWINTTEGATTNEDGNFSIHKPARSHLLVVSFIGFEMIRYMWIRAISNLRLCFVKEWN